MDLFLSLLLILFLVIAACSWGRYLLEWKHIRRFLNLFRAILLWSVWSFLFCYVISFAFCKLWPLCLSLEEFCFETGLYLSVLDILELGDACYDLSNLAWHSMFCECWHFEPLECTTSIVIGQFFCIRKMKSFIQLDLFWCIS